MPDDEKFLFENLDVYQRGVALASELTRLGSKLPLQFTRLRDQLIGAAISFPLNIAEGSGRLSSKDKANFYKNSRGSLFELIPILEVMGRLGLIQESDYHRFREEILNLARMLGGLIRSTKA